MPERPINFELDLDRGPDGKPIPKKKETLFELPEEPVERSENQKKQAKEKISSLIESTLEEAGLDRDTKKLEQEMNNETFINDTIEHHITLAISQMESDETLYPTKFMEFIQGDLNGQNIKVDGKTLRGMARDKLKAIAGTYKAVSKKDYANKLENLAGSI